VPNAIASSVNNRGEVVGAAQGADGNFHMFWWTKQTGMQDLGNMPGDFATVAPCCNTINNSGEIVGFSLPGPLGSGRAFVRRDKALTDLNTLIPPNSGWYLQAALSINDAGEIVGYGTIKGETHAFLATPR